MLFSFKNSSLNLFWGCMDVISDNMPADFYLAWVLTPLLVTFLLPGIILLMIYLDILILYIYKLHWGVIVNAFEHGIHNVAVKLIAAIWDGHARIWHGYEVHGMENIPEKDGALIIYYHGALPIDVYYFLSHYYLNGNRLIYTVADKFLFKLPGFSLIAETMKVIPGTVQECTNILKADNLLAISPGGVYEAQFGNSCYEVMWKNRLGFAKAALESKKSIIPMFTENIREAFISVSIGRRFWMKLYSLTRLPMVPILGGFPVKLRTYIGEPIPYEPCTPEELKTKVEDSIKAMIAKHQRLPGSITRALIERVYTFKKKES